MTADEIVAQLATLGSASTKKTLLRHGAREPLFGVKVGDLKTIVKKVKTDHDLALALYDTGISDAMYLAGLIADPPRMTKAQLRKWMKAAYWSMLAEYTVAWVAAESRFGAELAAEWVDAKAEPTAAGGWATYSGLVALVPDDELDLVATEKLLDRVRAEIGTAANQVRYTMNGFVISVGGYVAPLTAKAKAVAKAVGVVKVDMGDTACKVPDAAAYIAKIEALGRVGVKRTTVRC